MSSQTSPSAVFRRRVSAVALACVASLSALPTSAHGASTHPRARIPVVEVKVDSTSITGPSRLRPGFTTFHTTSTHPGTDSLAVVRLDGGVSYAQIFRYLARGDLASVFQHVSGEGGIAHGGPHNGRRWTADLRGGRYLFVDDEANLFAKLRVTGERHHTVRPRSEGTITFEHGAFTLPTSFGAGTWRLRNHDTIQHELGLVRIRGGHSRADVRRVLAEGTHPRWLDPQGTVNLIGPRRSAWVTLHGIRGFYVLLDYLPMYQGVGQGPVAQFRHVHGCTDADVRSAVS
jgi:hypothetical protein